jgi:hypothetical protein
LVLFGQVRLKKPALGRTLVNSTAEEDLFRSTEASNDADESLMQLPQLD